MKVQNSRRVESATKFSPQASRRGDKIQKIITLFRCAVYIILLLFTIHYPLSTVYAEDKGPPVSIELRDVELRDVLRALGQEHGINIVVDEKVTGKITVSLRNIPLWDAIDSILKGKGYSYVKDGNIVRVVLMTEDEDLVISTLSVKYATAKELESVVKRVLSKKGDVTADPRSNTLVIKDTPSAIARVEQLLKQVDVKTGQVMIEAKIVEVNINAREELGIQWGSEYVRGDVAVFSGGTKQNSTDTTFTPLTQGIGVVGTGFNVNLPAAVGRGFGGALGIGIISKRALLDLQLSALEEKGNAKILSSPKVMVLDNQEATIASGTQIFIPNSGTTTNITTSGTATGTGTGATSTSGVTEKEATLRLTVTPHVIDNDQISLKISTKREEFDFSRAVLGVPPKNTREAQTGVIVKNGETIVIGGIYTESNSEGESGVPLLSKIPVLGWLFKKESKRKDKSELLIFITPQIKTENL